MTTGPAAGPGPDRAAAQAAKDVLAEQLREDVRVVGIGLSRAAGDDSNVAGYVIEVRLSDAEGAAAVPQSVYDVPVRTRVVGPIEPR